MMMRTARPAGSGNGINKPRVALVVHDVDSNTPGGMERVCTELIRHASSKVDFTVVSSSLSEELREFVEWRRVPVLRRPMPLKLLLFFIAAGLRLSTGRYDLVNSVGAVVPNRVDVASVHHCHAGFVAKTGRLAPANASPARRLNIAINRLLALAAERWCYRPHRVRLLAAVSDQVGAEVASQYPGIPVVTTPNGVDLETFAPDPDVRRAVRRRLGVDEKATVALFVGGDWPLKGLEPTIRGLGVAARLRAEPVRLWVVGRGEEARFRALAEDCGVGDRVAFLGFHSDVDQFFKAADIFVFPSLYEAFALVVLEAAASGLAIIATPVGGNTSLIGADDAGLLVDPTPESIGKAISRLASDPQLRSRLAEAARKRVGDFGWGQSAAAVLEVYRRLLDGEAPNGSEKRGRPDSRPEVGS